MEYENVTVLPAPMLRNWIRSYQGFRYGGLDPGAHRGLPSGGITFIVSLDGPTRITEMPGAHGGGEFNALVGGLHSSPASIAHPGHGAGISIDVSPLARQTIFGVPAAALAETVVDLSELVGAAGTELLDRLHGVDSWVDRFEILDHALVGLVADPVASRPEVVHAWQLLVESGGVTQISEVAREVGWSRRHLAARFSSEFGLSPKLAARILRFQRACSLLDRGFGAASSATEAGYYDQAHMTNDWHEFAGTTPSAWFGHELRDRTGDDPVDREWAGSTSPRRHRRRPPR